MATGKKVARKLIKKSDAIRKEYPIENYEARERQKKKVEKITGISTKAPVKTTKKKSEAIRKEYPNFNVVSRDQQSRKVDKVTGNVKKEYAMTSGERRNHEYYLKRKGLKK